MQRENNVKRTLKAGGSVFGSWTITSSPMVANVMAEAGLDFVTIDMEHGPTTFETAEAILYAIEAGGSTPMLRLGEWSEPTILRGLEIGAQGLLVSHISTAEQARRIVSACKYPPEGERGLSPYIRRHGYSETTLPEKLGDANAEMLTGVIVEDAEGLQNLADIAAIPGLDLIYLGIYDISLSLGVPGSLNDPRVLEIVRTAVGTIEQHGIAPGAVGRDRDHVRTLVELGFRYISYLVDTAIIRDGFETALGWYQELVAPS